MRRRTKLLLTASGGTLVATVVLILLILNIVSFVPQVSEPMETDFKVGDPLFMRSVNALMGHSFTEGNDIQALRNGDEIFPAMLRAIRQAEYSINFETFVYWTGDIAEEFAQALAGRAREGVQVRVLLDFLGSTRMNPQLIELMREAGAQVERFRPISWYTLDRANNRTHRKLLIIDGRIGFTGGVGIGDEWLGDAEDENHWRDTHFEVRGPVVAQMQAGFAEHWIMARNEVIQGEEFFPPLKPVGDMLAQAFNSSAMGGTGSVRTLFLLSIAGARESIRIGTPYFVPDAFLMEALKRALARGVEVEILTTGYVDSILAQANSRARWGELLLAGARFYRYDPTLYHTKVLVVDDIWSNIGSANFDNRSFLYNDENQINVLDRDFAADLSAQFERDKLRSQQVTYEEWAHRPWRERFVEWWSRIFESQV